MSSREHGLSEVQKIIVERYTTVNVAPKGFATEAPMLASFSDLMTYKAPKKRNILDGFKKMRDSNEIDQRIVKLFGLEYEIHSAVWVYCEKAHCTGISNCSRPAIDFIFDFSIRVFIQVIFQLPRELAAAQLDPTGELEHFYVLEHTTSVISMLAKFGSDERVIIRALMPLFFDAFVKQWREIFGDRSPAKLKEIVLGVFSASLMLAQGEIKDGYESCCFSSVVGQMAILVSMINCDVVQCNFSMALTHIFSGIYSCVRAVSDTQKVQVGSVVINIIKNAKLYAESPDEAVVIGSMGLNIYGECTKVMDNETSFRQFKAIIDYVIWIIETFDVDSSVVKVDTARKEHVMTEKIEIAEYLSTVELLPDNPKLHVNPNLVLPGERLVAIATRSKGEITMTRHLVNSLKEKIGVFTAVQYQHFLVFALDVLRRIRDDLLYNEFKDDWSVLMHRDIFPDDPNAPYDVNLRNAVLIIIFRCFLHVPESRERVTNVVCELIGKIGLDGLRHITPLLNTMLANDPHGQFGSVLVSTALFGALIVFAMTDLAVFDFLRHFIITYPFESFKSSELLAFCVNCYDCSTHRKSIWACMDMAISVIGRDECAYGSTMNIVKCVSKILCLEEEKQSADIGSWIRLFATIIRFVAPKFKPFLGNYGAFDAIARIIVSRDDQKIFSHAVRAIKTWSHGTWKARCLLASPQCSVNMILWGIVNSNFKKVNIEVGLFDLLVNARSCIVNEFAIRLLLLWSVGNVREREIMQKLLKICSMNTGNTLRLQQAGTVTFLLNRIKSIEDEVLAGDLCNLIDIVSCTGFSISSMFELINLLKCKNSIMLGRLLSLVNGLLQPLVHKESMSFFYFDGSGTGIIGPIVEFRRRLGAVTTCCVHDVASSAFQTIFSAVWGADAEQRLYIGVIDRHVSVVCGTGAPQQFQHRVSTGAWHKIAIFIETNTVRVTVDDKRSDRIIVIPDIPSGQLAVSWAVGQNKQIESLIGSVAAVSVYSNFEQDDLLPNQPRTTVLDARLSDHDRICWINPEKVQGGTWNGSGGLSAVLHGTRIHNQMTMKSQLSQVHVLLNVIPLLGRLSDGESLSNSSGTAFGKTVLSLLHCGLSSSERVMTSFEEHNGFTLLIHFLLNVRAEYMNDAFLDLLAKLHRCGSASFRAGMMKWIWFNFGIAHNLDARIQKFYFKELLPSIVSADTIDKDVCDSLLYQLVEHYAHDMASCLPAWDFAGWFLKSHLNARSAEFLLSVMIAAESENLIILALSMLEGLIKAMNPVLLSALKMFDYLGVFVFLLANESTQIQLGVLECMRTIISVCNPDARSLASAMCQSVVLICNTGAIDSILAFMVDIIEAGRIEFLPVACRVLMMDDSPAVNFYGANIAAVFVRYANEITRDPLWPMWIVNFSPQLLGSGGNDAIGRMICGLINNITDVTFNVMNHIREYEIASIAESGDAFAPIYGEILKAALRTSMNEQFRETRCVEFIYIAAFESLFFHPYVNSEESAESAATYLDVLPFLRDRFSWFTKEHHVTYSFYVRVGDYGDWLDLEIATLLLSNQIPVFRSVLSDGWAISSIAIIAYVLATTMRFTAIDDATIANVRSAFPSFWDEDCHLASSIIAAIHERI